MLFALIWYFLLNSDIQEAKYVTYGSLLLSLCEELTMFSGIMSCGKENISVITSWMKDK